MRSKRSREPTVGGAALTDAPRIAPGDAPGPFASECPAAHARNFAAQDYGALAQLGERLICIQEVRSSILLGSTKQLFAPQKARWHDRVFCLQKIARMPGGPPESSARSGSSRPPPPDLIVKNRVRFFAIQSDELTSFREKHISYFADPASASDHGVFPEAK